MLEALWIVLLGMAITFAVLGVLLVVMMSLNRLIAPAAKQGTAQQRKGHSD